MTPTMSEIRTFIKSVLIINSDYHYITLLNKKGKIKNSNILDSKIVLVHKSHYWSFNTLYKLFEWRLPQSTKLFTVSLFRLDCVMLLCTEFTDCRCSRTTSAIIMILTLCFASPWRWVLVHGIQNINNLYIICTSNHNMTKSGSYHYCYSGGTKQLAGAQLGAPAILVFWMPQCWYLWLWCVLKKCRVAICETPYHLLIWHNTHIKWLDN